MVYEWTKVELYGANNDGQPRRYTIADGVSVSKGQLLYLTQTRQASGASLGSAPVAGVAMEDHIAGQGITSISCWTDGVFNVTASAALVAGEPVMADGKTPNTICGITSAASGACLGWTLQNIAAAAVGNVRLIV